MKQDVKWGVVFDCDSTLSTIEGIDELARQSGQYAVVEALTQQAMAGEIPLEAVYEKRLQLIQPRQDQILAVAAQYLRTMVPEALNTMRYLRQHGAEIAIVSGGLLPAIIPLAVHLGIDDVFAVPIHFDVAGHYQGISPHPLTTAQGKAEVVRLWRAAKRLDRVLMIGDGMSDAAAKAEGAASHFVAYTAVVRREQVLKHADWESASLLEAVRHFAQH